MSNSLVVLAHPNRDSYCAALAQSVASNLRQDDLCFHDLYAEQFNPLLSSVELAGKGSLDQGIQEHQKQLSAAKRLVAVFPDWWGASPAILKGWIDRVWRPGVSYSTKEEGNGRVETIGLLKGLSVSIIVTSEGPPPFGEATDTGEAESIPSRPKGALLHRKSTVESLQLFGRKAIDQCVHPIVSQWRDQVANFAGASLDAVLWCGPLRNASYARKQAWLEAASSLLQ